MAGKRNKGIDWDKVWKLLVSIFAFAGSMVAVYELVNYFRLDARTFYLLIIPAFVIIVWLIALVQLVRKKNPYVIPLLAVTLIGGVVVGIGLQSYKQTEKLAAQNQATQQVQSAQTARWKQQTNATQRAIATEQVTQTQQAAVTATEQVIQTQQAAATATRQWINQAREEKLILLIAGFDGPEDVYGLRNELIEELKGAVQNYDDTEIITIEEVVTPTLGSEYALELGYKNQADLVIWAWYRPTEKPNVTIHVENLSPDQFAVSGFSVIQGSELYRPDTNLAELESFEFQKRLGSETTNLVNFLLGNIQYKHKNWTLALDRFEQVLNSREETLIVGQKFILLYTGLCYYNLDQPVQALSYYDQAIQIDPQFTKPYNNKGAAFNRLEQYEDALKALNKAIQLDPNYTLAYINRGTAHYGSGQYQEAMDDYNKAIELEPKIPAAYYGRGNVHLRQEQYEKAIDSYNEAIRLYSKYVDAYLNRGISYRELSQYDHAIEDFNKAVELNPDYMVPYANRGLTFFYLEQYDDAINDFNQAVELGLSHPDVYYYRGLAYERIGKATEAEADFKKYEELTGQKAP